MEKIQGSEWSDAELAASVAAYRKMQQLEHLGEPYVKRRFYEQLELQFGRDAKAFERRMQNISAVLNEMGEPWLKGLAPGFNVGSRVASKLRKMLLPGGLPRYHAKLPAMRQWLISVARSGGTVTYADVMAAFDLDRFSLRAALGALGHEARRRGEPVITALIVGSGTGRCSGGLFKEFGIADDEAERNALHSFWRQSSNDGIVADPEPAVDSSLKQRASRFARQAVRPEQVAFRNRVYRAYKGSCAISSCSIQRALDAAHRAGRDWRKGHNRASDGILLRKDLHALYDAGLLEIDKGGRVSILAEALEHYGYLDGVRITTSW